MHFIEPFAFLINVGYFMFNPTFQQLLFYKTCTVEYGARQPDCFLNSTLNHMVQKEVSKLSLYVSVIQFIPGFFSPIFIGYFSSKMSPEKLFYMPCLTFLLLMLLGVLYSYIPSLKIIYLIPAYSLPILFGGLGGFKVLCMNYITLTTTEKQRSLKFILFESSCIIGLFTSGILSGFLIKYLYFNITILICMLIISVGLFYSAFLDPVPFEKMPNAKKIGIGLKKTIFIAISQCKPNLYIVFLLSFSQFALPFGETGSSKLIIVYSLRDTFNFSPTQVGYLLATLSSTRAIGCLLFLPFLMKYLKIKEWILCLCILPLQIGYFVLLAFAKNRVHLFCGSVIIFKLIIQAPLFMILQDIYRPVFMSTVARLFDEEARSFVFGLQVVFSTAGIGLGGIVANYIYMATIEIFPGLAFLIFGMISLIATVLGTNLVQTRNSVISEYQDCSQAEIYNNINGIISVGDDSVSNALFEVRKYICKDQEEIELEPLLKVCSEENNEQIDKTLLENEQ